MAGAEKFNEESQQNMENLTTRAQWSSDSASHNQTDKEKHLWTLEQSQRFLETAKDHQWYLGYLFMLTYGLRCGETLGLRWSDIDFEQDTLCVRQQIQKLDGALQALPVKTNDSQRKLPLSPHLKALLLKKAKDTNIDLSDNTPCFEYSAQGLILTNKIGGTVDPHNFNRAFFLLIEKAGVPRITPHTNRHMAATLNKNIGTPLKDVQQILGHSNSEITRKIYQHGDSDVQRRAITAIDALLHQNIEKTTLMDCCQEMLSGHNFDLKNKSVSGLAYLLRLGESGGVRTHDTGLKSCIIYPRNNGLTSVIKRLRTTNNNILLGSVAVYNCCHINRGRKTLKFCREMLCNSENVSDLPPPRQRAK